MRHANIIPKALAWKRLGLLAALALALWATTSLAQTDADDLATRMGLSDLASYRAALSGRPTSPGALEPDKPPAVSFRELWDHPERWAGQRVQIEGNVVRVFRQDAFGGFPPLAELWLATKAGDLFCTVFPRSGENSTAGKATTELGANVSFTGTFLKTIRYTAADQTRLAPLVVGNRPPLRICPHDRVAVVEQRDTTDRAGVWWLGLALALLAALVLAYLHIRPRDVAKPWRVEERSATHQSDPEFINPEDAHGEAGAGQ